MRFAQPGIEAGLPKTGFEGSLEKCRIDVNAVAAAVQDIGECFAGHAAILHGSFSLALKSFWRVIENSFVHRGA